MAKKGKTNGGAKSGAKAPAKGKAAAKELGDQDLDKVSGGIAPYVQTVAAKKSPRK
jgi:hypothetical protein